MAAPTYVGAGAAAWIGTTAGTVSPGLPAGWAEGDVHVLVTALTSTAAVTSVPGWTSLAAASGDVGGAFRHEVWWRRAVAGDADPVVTFATASVARGGRVYGVRGAVATGSPFDTGSGAPTVSANATADTSIEFVDLTTTVADCLVLALSAYDDDFTTATMTGWTQPAGAIAATILGTDLTLVVHHKTVATAGAAGAVTQTVNASNASVSAGILLALISVAGPPPEPEPPAAVTTVRTTTLEVYVHDGVGWQYDGGAYAASCSFGFDQRVAEATVRRTGGGEATIQYWSPIQIDMGCDPGHGLATRFSGYVVPLDNVAFPVEGVLHCRGRLYRAQWVRNTTPGGTVMAEPGAGVSDQEQVETILEYCGVPLPTPDHGVNLGGTGKALGSEAFAFDNPAVPGPFVWAEGQAGLDYIDALDAVSVPDDASGRYRTFETLGGEIFRTKLATAPETTPDFSFTEGVDVLDARITRDPNGAANVVTVTGAPTILSGLEDGIEDLSVYRFTAGTASAPYLPPGLDDTAHGYPAVTASFSSPLIEKALVVDPDVAGDVIACEAVAQFLLQEHNCVLDTLEFSTPRDDLLGPGQTIHLHSPRLGITDEDQHYWLQHLEVTVDERGVFTQRLVCLRRS